MNLWKQFESLLAGPPRLLGDVVTDHQDGTVTVQQLGGGLLRVAVGEQSVAEGARVFVRDGRLDGEAPALPMHEIEI